jgi:PTH1 family peptidyl-tRNA hydrolase
VKYLIVGLGNIGPEYANTRHNAGFMIVDALAEDTRISFEDRRYGFVGRLGFKGRMLILLKPSTYVNLSGRAVHYWLKKEQIPVENLLVVLDDIALPFGIIRLRARGGDGGHNGLIHINQILGTHNYARLRFGIGSPPAGGRGAQVSHVLGPFTPEEEEKLPERLKTTNNLIRSFVLTGVERTMNQFNNQ